MLVDSHCSFLIVCNVCTSLVSLLLDLCMLRCFIALVLVLSYSCLCVVCVHIILVCCV